ncbi:DedA family protein [Candidatus Pacearchaeota archaeon]|nr:DedA family protein [Candidatus Pacearchaeota archaeon]
MVFVENLLGMSREFFGFWGYIVVFVAIFLESFPFIGAFVPGGMIALFICGFLSRLGFFVFWKVMLVSILASVMVDLVGYLLGKRWDLGFICRRARVFLVKRKTIEKVGVFVREHSGKALVLGKINPVTRSISPFIVGNERVRFDNFILYSVIGSVLWVVSFMAIGYVFGDSFELVREAERFILWAMVVLFGGFYIYYIGNLFREFFNGKSKVGAGSYCKKHNKKRLSTK